MESDDLWMRSLRDAARDLTDSRFCRFFAQLIVHCQPSSPEELLEKFIDRLCPVRPGWDYAARRRRALMRIAYYLQEYNKTLFEVGFDWPENMDIDFEEFLEEDRREEQQGFTTLEDGVPRKMTWMQVAETERARLNEDQTRVFNRIVDAINDPLNADGSRKQHLFFVTGEGGTGKTFLFNSLIAHVKGAGGTYLATATTGISALLIRGGRTAHSALRIRNDVDEDSTPAINFESRFAQDIRVASMILIDEVSMMDNIVLSYIDKTIRSCFIDEDTRHLPFAGKVVILSGDFKQLAPVVENGGRIDQIAASIRRCKLFARFEHLKLTQNMRLNADQVEFGRWLMEMGNGRNMAPLTDCVAVPETSMVDDIEALIDFCYPNKCLEDPVNRVDEMRGSSILCTTNRTTFDVNEKLLKRLPGEVKTFNSIDKVLCDPQEHAVALALEVRGHDYTTEAINKKTPTGLPPHQLKLKIGAIVMLIKNLSLRDGLSNGTMLQIVGFSGELIKCRRLDNNRAYDCDVYLSRVKFQHGTGEEDRKIQFTRIQYPIRLAFAVTINKAQGQTLCRVGLYFRGEQCFSHGQLYVAFSRVKQHEAIKIFNAATEAKRMLRNVVFKELLMD
ncbi:hypothetical protein L596_021632 [Steinernema carpocapsae]|nr:hypothetical protein L596_021632 [Steinernema carpocapsae]